MYSVFCFRCLYKRLTVLLEHACTYLEQLTEELEAEKFILQNSEFWKKVIEYKGSRKTDLEKNLCVQKMKSTVKRLINKLETGTITISDYHCLNDFSSKFKWQLLVEFMKILRDNINTDIQDMWDGVMLSISKATQKLEPLDQLSSKFIVKLSDCVTISDLQLFNDQLSNI